MGENQFPIDIRRIVKININELIQNAQSGTIQNKEFTRIWCDISLLPIYHIEYIINMSNHTQNGYNKDEAIVYGQLIRIFKLLCLQRRLVCERIMTTTLAAFFERMILEGSINLEYFITNFNGTLLNDFRLNSLKAEAFLEEDINNDIAKNSGQVSVWQENLLNSIHDTYKKAGSSYEEVRKSKVRLPSISEKFRSTGNQRLYDLSYRTKCHDIHGDWVDLTQNYLKYNSQTNNFSPCFEEYEVDLRQLNPILIICCEMLKRFVNDFLGHGLSHNLCDEIVEDQRLLFLLDDMHFNFLNKRDLLCGIDISLLNAE